MFVMDCPVFTSVGTTRGQGIIRVVVVVVVVVVVLVVATFSDILKFKVCL